MEKLKKVYKKILLVAAYTIIACTVYGYWFSVIWEKWYITLITIVAIMAVGCVVCYFYIKNDLKNNDGNGALEPRVDTPTELDPVSDLPVDKENQ